MNPAVKNTRAFINVNPTDVVLRRRVRVDTADGGWRYEDAGAVEEQRCRIIISNNQSATQENTTPDGKVLKLVGTAIFMPGADVKVDDLFPSDDDSEWIVSKVRNIPPWRIAAEVSTRA